MAQNLGRKRGRQPFAQHLGVRVRALCDKYDLPYTSGSLVRQYLLTLRTIHKLAAPDSFLSATSDDAPETASERKFGTGATSITRLGGPIVGLRTALRARVRRTHWRRAVTRPRAGPGD